MVYVYLKKHSVVLLYGKKYLDLKDANNK